MAVVEKTIDILGDDAFCERIIARRLLTGDPVDIYDEVVQSLRNYAFYRMAGVQSLKLTKLKTVNTYACANITSLTVLLCVLIFLISYIQSFFPPERSRKIMGRFHGVGANIVGALLGTVTPFCSCSSIPIFMGFTSAGLPLGVTFSFLISSPMVDLGSLVLLMSIFGLKIAIAYVLLGLVIAVIGGTLIEKLHMEDQIADFIRNSNSSVDIEAPDLTVKDRLIYAKIKL